MRHYRKCVCGLVCIALGVTGSGNAFSADSTSPAAANPAQRWVGGYAARGEHHHLWSAGEYFGYQNAAAAGFVEWPTASSIPLPLRNEQTVRAELRYEYIWGTIPLHENQVPAEERRGGPYSTTLDNHLIAGLLGRRFVLLPGHPFRPTLHLGAGFSLLDHKILKEGSLYNFNLFGGCGSEFDLAGEWSAFLDVRWEHFSNGGSMYLTDAAVIGLESVSAVVGLRHAF